MSRVIKLIAFFSLSLLSFVYCFAQDSSGIKQNWSVISKKTGEGKYELTFATSIPGNWQVYAPNQTLLDVKTTELRFNDSTIVQQGDFVKEGDPKQISSPIFENTTVSVYEAEAKWKAIIKINAVVPAKLQGTMLYTYGRNDEFYPSTIFPFVVTLEGGVESTTRILIPSIDIKHPVNPLCGDDDTAGKSLLKIFILGLIGGFIGLLTPCVFPMIPLTVSFFTKQNDNKKCPAHQYQLAGPQGYPGHYRFY